MRAKNFIILVIIALGIWACPSDTKVNQPILDYAGLITSGWTEFENQNYNNTHITVTFNNSQS